MTAPSPRNSATWPSHRSITSLQHSWYEAIVAARSSGSRRLASSVEPARSQKTTVICRRSAAALAWPESAGVAALRREIPARRRLRSPSGISSSLRSSSVSWARTSRSILCSSNSGAYCGKPIRSSQSAMLVGRTLPSVRRARGVRRAAMIEGTTAAKESISSYSARVEAALSRLLTLRTHGASPQLKKRRPIPRRSASMPHANTVVGCGEVTDPVSDAALVARCRAGEDEAWRELVERFSRYVYAIAVQAFGLVDQDAEDIFQEVFARTYERLEGLRDDAAIRPWLAQLTRRLCIDTLRGEGREEPVEEPEPPYVEQALDRLDEALDVH